MPKRESQLVRQIAGDDVGCSEVDCVFGHLGGMHTNGGCQCLKQDAVQLRRTLRQMSKVAHKLASLVLGVDD
jgi:hypothetical protein